MNLTDLHEKLKTHISQLLTTDNEAKYCFCFVGWGKI